ncbi:hypothetical protein RHSIM_Rhsim10G0213500 [Rhododendron simsii]|uniref:RRM domain-containing protein n=1 Tax=Rhododendron simsii TaxID=118357 RepID=A0A834GHE5_RHOSS|nr:hypothetical protein RHSIM_Rhsim10G0213500 [Rhododendron simsii]
MRTRNSTTPKPAAAIKTPPARKSAAKTPPNDSRIESATLKTADTNAVSTSTPTAVVDLKPPQQPVEQENASADAVEVTPETKVDTGAKTTRKVVVRKTPARTKTPTSAKAVPRKTPKSEQTEELKVGESSKKEEVGDAKDLDSSLKEESSLSIVEESVNKEELSAQNPEETKRVGDQNLMKGEEPPQEKEDGIGVEELSTVDLKAEQPVEQAKTSVDAVKVTLPAKLRTGVKTTKKIVVRKTVTKTKTPTSAKAVPRRTPKPEETSNFNVCEHSKKEEDEDAMDVDSAKKEEFSISNAVEPAKEGEPSVENVEETKKMEAQTVMIVKDPPQEEEEVIDVEQRLVLNVEESTRQEDPVALDVGEVSKSQEPGIPREEEEVKEEIREETRIIEDDVGSEPEAVNMEEDMNELRGEDTQCEDDVHGNERVEEGRDQEVLEEFGEEELAADDIPEQGEEAEALEEENMELTAAAKERKMRKELEIFVGGLDRGSVEEDVKKAFENIGDVVEVRLHRNTSTDKNKGYAFVKFATKEQASRALSEMKNPLICGKRCRTGPSEDNDSLFLGNICNTWTKEAIKQKLEDYGVRGVQNITLVADARHEGLSRGFAFIEFSCHADAMLAYKRLQKPDVIFGHTERTAKVAFAEPLREPDPDVMAQVKSVFIDGLPLNLDEDRVREQMKGYGEIARIMLARNMSTAKRRDYGFVDFTTHEAAVACVEGINDKYLGDGNSKTKVKARLSNPLPKTQAIKGGICGGFRIGRAGAGSFSKFGRGFGKGAHAFNRPNFQRGRGFNQRDNVPTWRMGFAREHDRDIQYPPFHRREMSGQGGWRDSFRGAHDASRGGAVPARPNIERGRHNPPDRGHGMPISNRRQPFPNGEGFSRTSGGRHFDDPYFYDGRPHGTKRPFFMADQDPDYIEPSRHRPRLDYSDPAIPFRTPHYRDSFEAGSSLYSHDYYGTDYGEGPYSSFYQNDHPYGGGFYH